MLTEQPRKKKIEGLDGLRAIAIIAVILYHMFPFQVKGGFLGVSLFFVLSGYLIAISTESSRRAHKYRIMDFYKKRIKRIYPSVIACVFITVGFFYVFSPQTIKGILAEVISILCGVNNWWQISQNSTYFTKIANASPFTHVWSLSLELQFYLIWPLIYFWYLVLSRVASKRKKFSYKGFGFLAIFSVISILLMVILFRPGEDATRVYYGTDTRAFALLFGVLLGMVYMKQDIWEKIITSIRKSSSIILAFLTVGVLASFLFMDGQSTFTYWGGMQLVTIAFGIIIVIVSDDRLLVGEWLSLKPIAWIGERSYEMYLWMYPVIFLFNIKKWTRLPISWLIQFIVIILLAAWLHTFTQWLAKGKYSFSGGGLPMKIKKISFAGVTLILAIVCVLGGCATLTSGKKNSDSKQLEAELEENAKHLEEEKNEEPENTEVASSEAVTAETEETTETGETTEAAIEEKADPLESVTCVGDSVMLGAAPAIEEALPDDGVVDAKESRQVVKALEILEGLEADGKLGSTVVIALGTNGPFTAERGQELIDYLGKDRKIFWVNVYGANLQWEDQSNEAIDEVVASNDNVSLIDWNKAAQGNSEWFYQDGIHLKPEGQKAYADVIVNAIKAAAE
ncbi:MAG: acetyltransferase [Lachnospiraceae bacterium]|nr:acetyltransferase [Lachnospiraceae bacterium]